jgi:hypothetical protein
MTEEAVSAQVTNRFDRMEIAGAFGDLGTLVPFVVAYLAVLRMDPSGVLFAFGMAMIVCGLVYRTPIPVQPMKAAGAIATTQAAQTLTLTPTMVYGASLVTGLIWLVLGLTGTAKSRGEPCEAARRRRHRSRSRFRLHDRRREDDVSQLVDRRRGTAWHVAAAHQPRHTGHAPPADVRSRLWGVE